MTGALVVGALVVGAAVGWGIVLARPAPGARNRRRGDR